MAAAAPLNLRDYQIDAVERVKQRFRDGEASAQLALACGAGKSRIAIAFVQWLSRACHQRQIGVYRAAVYAVPTRSLVNQTLASLRHFLDPAVFTIVPLSSEYPKPNDKLLRANVGHNRFYVFVSTYHSAHHIAPLIDCEMELCGIVLDESHYVEPSAPANVYNRLLDDKFLQAHFRLKMTATLLNQTDDLVMDMSYKEAAARGLIRPLRVVVSIVTDSQMELGAQANPDATCTGCVKAMARYSQGARCLLFTNRIKQSEALMAYYAQHYPNEAACQPIRLLSGRQSRRERDATLQWYRQTEQCAIISSQAIQEGVDIPATSSVHFSNARQSFVSIIQCVGRASRPFPGHEHCSVILNVHWRVNAAETLEEAILRSGYTATLQALVHLMTANTCAIPSSSSNSGIEGSSDAFVRGFEHLAANNPEQFEVHIDPDAAAALDAELSPAQPAGDPDRPTVGSLSEADSSGTRRIPHATLKRAIGHRLLNRPELSPWKPTRRRESVALASRGTQAQRDAHWESQLAAYGSFKLRHGGRAPLRTEEPSLYRWAAHSRFRANNGTLREDRRARLQRVHFRF